MQGRNDRGEDLGNDCELALVDTYDAQWQGKRLLIAIGRQCNESGERCHMYRCWVMAIPDFVVRLAGATEVTSKRVDMRVDLARQLSAMDSSSAQNIVGEQSTQTLR